jgi:hypothetical protein
MFSTAPRPHLTSNESRRIASDSRNGQQIRPFKTAALASTSRAINLTTPETAVVAATKEALGAKGILVRVTGSQIKVHRKQDSTATK